MNRFILAEDVRDCATFLCDQHVNKMIIEEAQMLCTAVRLKMPAFARRADAHLYRMTHVNHPCAVWARENMGNFRVAYGYWLSMAVEYQHRFLRMHETYRKLSPVLREAVNDIEFERTFERKSRTPHPQCFGDLRSVCETDEPWPVNAYRLYYRAKGTTFRRPMKWSSRPAPFWLKEAA